MRLRPIRCFSVLSVLIVVAGLSGCAEQTPQTVPAAPPPPQSVGVVVVESSVVPVLVELPGRTSPYLIAEVRPQVTGIIQERAFLEGSEVKAGDLLYQIDPASYRAALDSARAGVARAEAAFTAAKLKADRFAGLAKVDAVSKQANDDAVAGVQLAQADIAAARAALDKARIDLDYTRLTAPIGGRIGRSAVTAGALVTANQPEPLATVQQLDPIYVDLTQSSAELMRLRHDLEAGRMTRVDERSVEVDLVLEDGSEYGHPGRLAFSEVSVDPATGSVTLRAVFPNPGGDLLPGMYVRARLEQGVADSAILVPHAGISRDPRGNPVAMVVNEENIVESRAVQTTRSLGDQWVVTAGLESGDRVIVEGLQRVRPGALVAPEILAVSNAVRGE